MHHPGAEVVEIFLQVEEILAASSACSVFEVVYELVPTLCHFLLSPSSGPLILVPLGLGSFIAHDHILQDKIFPTKTPSGPRPNTIKLP
jgi:hypothetical protein